MKPSLSAVSATAPEPPYPSDIRARGFCFDIDWERIEQSDTWTLCPPLIRPWLLMLWSRSWLSAPAGTWPPDDSIISARIGMEIRQFKAHRDILMRGWYLASDGRLYHPVITELVLSMCEARKKDRERVARYRDRHLDKKQEDKEHVTRYSRISNGDVTMCNATASPSASPSTSKEENQNQRKVHVPQKRGTRLTDDFNPPDDALSWARQKRPDLDLDEHLAEFRDYWQAVPGRHGLKTDWLKTWKNSIRKAPPQRKAAAAPQASGPGSEWR